MVRARRRVRVQPRAVSDAGLGRPRHQRLGRGVQGGDGFQPRALGAGVQARRAVAGGLGALALYVARGGDTGGDLGAALGRRRQGEVGGGHRRHLDGQIDAVHQRAGDPAW